MKPDTTKLVAAILSITLLTGADWRQFRGNDANGVSSEQKTPTSLSGDAVAWKSELPGRGLSGPIIIGDRVVLTCSSGTDEERLHVLCFSDSKGELLWQRQFWATGRTMCHNKMCNATPTPASDGERIFAFYSSNDLVCLDLDGNLKWYRGLGHDYPNASNSLGMASSPVVVGDTLVVQVESDAESFAVGIDVETGVHKWKIDRRRKANWSSPTILRGKTDHADLAILQSSFDVVAIDPQTGKQVWKFDEGGSSVPSSTAVKNAVYVPTNGVTVLNTSATGDSFETGWSDSRLAPSTASPLIFNDQVFTLNRAGVVTCASTGDGDVLWRLRLKGPFSGSPIAGGGHLYLINESGLGWIVKPGEAEGEIISEIDLGETVLCTPALANGALYVRSDEHLWKIGG